LTDKDIEKIMKRVDADHDGTISYGELAAKLRDDPVFEHRMLERCNKRILEINDLMIHHMTTPEDAYRMVSYNLLLTCLV
jgi:Ca2+-binding EF-hand superfamily protein